MDFKVQRFWVQNVGLQGSGFRPFALGVEGSAVGGLDMKGLGFRDSCLGSRDCKRVAYSGNFRGFLE